MLTLEKLRKEAIAKGYTAVNMYTKNELLATLGYEIEKKYKLKDFNIPEFARSVYPAEMDKRQKLISYLYVVKKRKSIKNSKYLDILLEHDKLIEIKGE